jgi:hypothetical protein
MRGTIMENVIVASTNLYALRSIHALWSNKAYANCFLITASMISSIAYHLVEHSKHGMPGIKFYRQCEKVLLNLDRFFAVGSILSFLRLYHRRLMTDRTIQIWIMIAVLNWILSEGYVFLGKSHKTPYNLKKYFFMFTHSIWHLCVYHISFLLVK